MLVISSIFHADRVAPRYLVRYPLHPIGNHSACYSLRTQARGRALGKEKDGNTYGRIT